MVRDARAVLVPILASVIACASEHGFANRPCPCTAGWKCNEAEEVCVKLEDSHSGLNTMQASDETSNDTGDETSNDTSNDTTTPSDSRPNTVTSPEVAAEREMATCVDGLQNGGETDVDCGGPCSPCGCFPAGANIGAFCEFCEPCGIGQGDCDGDEPVSGCAPDLVCGVDNLPNFTGDYAASPEHELEACVPPHCVNGLKDGDETAVDCGPSCGCKGPCAGKCDQVEEPAQASGDKM